jgi:hypothetical protein
MKGLRFLFVASVAALVLFVASGCFDKYTTANVGDDCSEVVVEFDPEAVPGACSKDGDYFLLCLGGTYQPHYDCRPGACMVYEQTETDPDTGKEIVLNALGTCEGDQGTPVGVTGGACDTGDGHSRACNQEMTAIVECSNSVWTVTETCATRCAVELSDYVFQDWFPRYRSKVIYCVEE